MREVQPSFFFFFFTFPSSACVKTEIFSHLSPGLWGNVFLSLSPPPPPPQLNLSSWWGTFNGLLWFGLFRRCWSLQIYRAFTHMCFGVEHQEHRASDKSQRGVRTSAIRPSMQSSRRGRLEWDSYHERVLFFLPVSPRSAGLLPELPSDACFFKWWSHFRLKKKGGGGGIYSKGFLNWWIYHFSHYYLACKKSRPCLVNIRTTASSILKEPSRTARIHSNSNRLLFYH